MSTKDAQVAEHGHLWHPDWGARMNSPQESARVRGLYLAEKDRVVGEQHEAGCKCEACGHFRGEFGVSFSVLDLHNPAIRELAVKFLRPAVELLHHEATGHVV